jgi:hypothetical protein
MNRWHSSTSPASPDVRLRSHGTEEGGGHLEVKERSDRTPNRNRRLPRNEQGGCVTPADRRDRAERPAFRVARHRLLPVARLAVASARVGSRPLRRRRRSRGGSGESGRLPRSSESALAPGAQRGR